MPRFSQPEIEQMSRLIAGGDISSALALYRTQYPVTGDKVFQDPDRPLIDGLLATQPSTLGHLHPAELREVQVVAAMTFLVGHATRPDKLLRAGQQWNYAISLTAAVGAVISNYNWMRDRAQMQRYGIKRAWRYLHSCDAGTCDACAKAGQHLYSDDNFPGSPVPGCTNLKDGCRCLALSLDPKDALELVTSGELSSL